MFCSDSGDRLFLVEFLFLFFLFFFFFLYIMCMPHLQFQHLKISFLVWSKKATMYSSETPQDVRPRCHIIYSHLLAFSLTLMLTASCDVTRYHGIYDSKFKEKTRYQMIKMRCFIILGIWRKPLCKKKRLKWILDARDLQTLRQLCFKKKQTWFCHGNDCMESLSVSTVCCAIHDCKEEAIC